MRWLHPAETFVNRLIGLCGHISESAFNLEYFAKQRVNKGSE